MNQQRFARAFLVVCVGVLFASALHALRSYVLMVDPLLRPLL